MSGTTQPIRKVLPNEVLFAALPGPTRKRQPSAYCYRLRFQAPEDGEGCLMLWEVFGGREIYQVAMERLPDGEVRWHCTCADAVYRGEEGRHQCKHVRGLLEQGRRESCEATVPV